MSEDWNNYMTRKDRLERIALKCQGLTEQQAAIAWRRLIDLMFEMSSAEAPKIPKFSTLLLAIFRGSFRARSTLDSRSVDVPSEQPYQDEVRQVVLHPRHRRLTVGEQPQKQATDHDNPE